MNRWMGRGLVVVLSLLATTALAGSSFFRIVGPADTEITGMGLDGTITWTNSSVGVSVIIQRATTLIGEGDWSDYLQQFVNTPSMAVTVTDPDTPGDMAFIPGGTNAGTDPDFGAYSLTVDSFYMDRYEVTKALWDEVYTWASTNGYTFANAGLCKATNHPVHNVSWYDVVKWCNARSQKEGRPAVYSVNGSVYKTGQADNVVQTSAAGYRLPTDEEWEYAARGGLRGRRFPWGDTIQHARENYWSSSSYNFDTSPTRGYHPTYITGGMPYTSPVGAFAPNGYGLYDMTGDLWEWCFDWYPGREGSYRVIRGGSWDADAYHCQVGLRNDFWPAIPDGSIGFRAVLPPGPAVAP